jgi:hypothetical protein
MKKHVYGKTLALMLATTTTLQLTGVTSQLLNGVPFITANAVTSGGAGYISTTTTSAAVGIGYRSTGTIYGGRIEAIVPTKVELESDLPSSIDIIIINDGTQLSPVYGITSAKVIVGTTTAAVTWTFNSERTAVVGKMELPLGSIILGGNNYDLFYLSTQASGITVPVPPLPPGAPPLPGMVITPTVIPLEFNTTIVGTGTSPVITTGAAVTTGPSVVRIVGREKVGKYLTAELRKADGTEFTTSAGVAYKWYRLDDDNDDISEGTLIGTEKTYKLVGRDKENYIRVLATYNGVTYTDITGDIDRRSSSSASSSSSSNSSSSDEDTRDNNRNNYIQQAHIQKDANGIMKLMENGKLISGWKYINNQWFLADYLGNIQTGWRQENGVWYFLNNDGAMATGWHQDSGTWYLLNNNGGMITGWQLVGGKWYLLHTNGAMATGWQKSNGTWYYLYSDGSMASDTVIDGYKVDSNGAWIR